MKIFKLMCGVILCGVLFACGDTKTAQTHLVEAESFLKENKTSEAIIALKNAIKLEPKNATARYRLGKLYLALGDADNAEKELERAHQLKYADNKVLPLLARAYYLLGSDDDIIALKGASETLAEESKTKFLAYLTVALLRAGENEKAKAASLRASELLPSGEFSLLATAFYEQYNKNLPVAAAHVTRSLSINPNNADALMLQGQIASLQGEYEKSLASFQNFAKIQPKAGFVQLFIADAFVKTKQFNEAEKIADAILAKLPNQPFANAIKASVRFEAQDYQAALTSAKNAFNANFNTYNLQLIAGVSAFYLNNFEQAHLHLSAIAPFLVQEHPALRMLVVSQLKLGLIDDLSESLSEYQSTDAESSKFLTALSFELLEIGATDVAKNIVQKANVSNKNAEQSAKEGILKLMMNDPSGINDLEDALKINPELREAELALAFSSVKTGDIKRANQIAEKWQVNYPDKSGGFNLQAAILFKENKLDEAKTILEKSLTIENNNAYALIELTKLARFQNEPEQATLLLKRAINAHPENIKVLQLYFSENRNEKGLAKIKSTYDKNSEKQNITLLYANALIALQRYNDAENILNNFPRTVKTSKRYWQLLLLAQSQAPEQDKRYDTFLQWKKNNPYHIEPVILLADYWVKKKNLNKAISQVNSGLEYTKNDVRLLFVKLDLLIKAERIKEAKALYEDVSQLAINKQAQSNAKGRILFLEEKYTEAATVFNQLYQKQPSSQNMWYLVIALKKDDKKDQAIGLLEKHIQGNPEDSAMRNILASFYLDGKHSAAAEQYRLVIKSQPENVTVLNNLAWLTMQAGQLEEALVYIEKAYKLAPTVADIVDTYSQILLKTSQKREALVKAKEAYQLAKKKNIDITLNYIEVLIANKRNNEAQRLLGNIQVDTVIQKEKSIRLSNQLKGN